MPLLTLKTHFSKDETWDDFIIDRMERIPLALASPFTRDFCRSIGSGRRDDWDYVYNDPEAQVFESDIRFLRDEVRKYRITKGTLPPPLMRDPKEVAQALFQERKERERFKRFLRRNKSYVDNEGFICYK